MLTPRLLTFVKAQAITLVRLAAAVCVCLLPARVQASTDDNGVATYQYGTTVRDFDGGTRDTIVGTADSGAIDQANSTITVTVSAAKLNDILSAAGHNLIARRSVFCGLRGFSFLVDSLALEDYTPGRDGVQRAVSFRCATHTGLRSG